MTPLELVKGEVTQRQSKQEWCRERNEVSLQPTALGSAFSTTFSGRYD